MLEKTILANVASGHRFLNSSSERSQIPLNISWLSSHSVFRKLDSQHKG